MRSKLAVMERLNQLQMSLEKVDGTLNTILTIGNFEGTLQPSPKEVLNTLQLLADIVSPACEELEAIMKGMNAEDPSPPLSQGKKTRVQSKGH